MAQTKTADRQLKSAFVIQPTNTNVIIGLGAGNALTTGDRETFLGNDAGRNNTTGQWNTAVGYASMYDNTTGGENSALGLYALQHNIGGNYNTAVGSKSGRFNTGLNNTFIGAGAGANISSGNGNTIIGRGAATLTTTANNNILIGMQAANNLIQGDGNVMIGNFSTYGSGNQNYSNRLYIGNGLSLRPLIGGDFNTQVAEINGQLSLRPEAFQKGAIYCRRGLAGDGQYPLIEQYDTNNVLNFAVYANGYIYTSGYIQSASFDSINNDINDLRNTSIRRLASTQVDATNNDPQPIWFLPPDYEFVVTHIVFRQAGADMTVAGGGVKFGYNSNSDDLGVVFSATELQKLVNSQSYIMRTIDTHFVSSNSHLGSNEEVLYCQFQGLGLNDLFAPIIVEVFGYGYGI